MSEKITIGIVDDNAALLQQLKENLTGPETLKYCLPLPMVKKHCKNCPH
jgi:hypothetical protein